MDQERVSVQETSTTGTQPIYLTQSLFLHLKYSEDPRNIIHRGNSGSLILYGSIGDDKVAVRKSPKTDDSLNEVAQLRQLNNINIIQYKFCHQDPRSIYLITELGHRTLEDLIKNVKKDVQLQLGRGVLCGLVFLHDRKIVHGDVKHQHVVVDAYGHAKLIDFKKCKEVKNEDEILHEIKKAGELEYYIFSSGTSYPEGEELWDTKDIVMHFIQCMTHPVPTERRSLQHVLSHPIFWDNKRRLRYLKNVGNLPKDYIKGKVAREIKAIKVNKSFNDWRKTMDKEYPTFLKKMDDYRIRTKQEAYLNNTHELLRFIRNAFIHRYKEAVKVNFTSMFPDLFETIYLFAQKKGWEEFDDD